MAVETSWFSLLPRSDQNIAATALVLALIALYAVDGSALAAAIGCGAALMLLYLNQATLGIGVPPATTQPTIDFWLDPVLRAALTWTAFPLVARLVADRLPNPLAGAAAGLALLVLPLLRYADPSPVLAAVLNPARDIGSVLRVPWLPLCALVALLVSVVVVTDVHLWRRLPMLLAGCAVAIALLGYTKENLELRGALHLSPSSGGALTSVEARVILNHPASTALWDGLAIEVGPSLPSRPTTIAGLSTMQFYPGMQETSAAGAHRIELAAGLEIRSSEFQLRPPSADLRIEAHDLVVVHGPSGHDGLLLIRQENAAAELVSIHLDDAGSWTASRPLPPGRFRLIVQVDDAWVTLDVAR